MKPVSLYIAIASLAISTAVLVSSCKAETSQTFGGEQSPVKVKLVETPAPMLTPKPTDSKPVLAVGWLPEYDENIKALVTEDMLNAPDSRMKKFCDVWPALSRDERKQFYADVIYSIAKPESTYNTQAMFIESTMGLDALTGYPVASEGHLQLSYQDSIWYKQCKFNWPEDKAALLRDMSVNGSLRKKGSFTSKALDRSIQNPYVNHACGIHIIDTMMRKAPTKEFADTLGQYWSTMRRLKNGLPRPQYKQVWAQMRSRNTPCK